MRTFALRLNPDPREGRPYSSYPTPAQYKKIHNSAAMDGFHEAVNFFPEGGVIRGYLPPKHLTAMRTQEPFALITVTAKTAKHDGNQLIGFQIGCVYEGQQQRTTAPAFARKIGFIWHYSCPASLSHVLARPLQNAREILLGNSKAWLRNPTVEIPSATFIRCLNIALQNVDSESERAGLERIKSAMREGLPRLHLNQFDDVAFDEAVAKAYQTGRSVPQGNPSPNQVRTMSYQFIRDPAVVAHALQLAAGICGDCKQPAPFISRHTGLPYLEVHHKRTLADGGEDTPENVIALCPNCHRKRHHG